MKLLIISVGKKHDPSLAEAVDDFTSRVNHYAPLEWKLVSPDKDAEKEGRAILKSLDDRDQVVLLDERGKEVDSPGLAGLIEKQLNASTHRLVFVIGGAYGVSDEVRKRAHTTIALSRLVFPHQLVRLILIEQIYRAFTILRGEKYHHS